MKRFLGLVAVALVSLVGAGVCVGQGSPRGLYLGQDPPGYSPVVFAPGIVSLPNRFEYCLTFSPDLDECVFGLTNSGWSVFNLRFMTMSSDSSWSEPAAAPFQGSGDGTDPFYSTTGDEIYFVSFRPGHGSSDIWRSSREGSGWGPPQALDIPINSEANEWGGGFAQDGTLYFCSGRSGGFGDADVYRAVTSPGGDLTVENLGAAVNGPRLEGSAFVAPDGSYVIFESQRTGGYGQSDLYISYLQEGVWTAPRNLGSAINTFQIEDCPYISPDGRYLFFNRRRAPFTAEQSEIWWVDSRAVFQPEASGVEDVRPAESGAILRNAPNPFSASTTITYTTPSPGFVAIKIYDVLGREVRSLVNAPMAPGTYSLAFDLPRGERQANGVYYYSLGVGDRRLMTAKMVSLR